MFDTKRFKEEYNTAKQTLSFCGVNAHHQNGKSDDIIKDVTTGVRKFILHASHCWRNVIYASLWTAIMNKYFNLINSIPTNFSTRNLSQKEKYQSPMILPLYQYSMVPKLKQTWITSILLDPQFMFLKFSPFW